MPRALVAEAEPDLRQFVVETLANNGWDVAVATDSRIGVPDAIDAVVADLGTAVRNHWIGDHAHKPESAKLVITSAVGAFLDDVRGEVDAVVRTPATREQLVHAIIEEKQTEPPRVLLDPLENPRRQRLLEERGLYNARSDPELIGIANLAARAVGSSSALITLIDAKRQIFLGHTGIPPDLAATGETPCSWSFCQHVVRSAAPLIVEDATEHPSFKDSPLVTLGLVRAYAGVPIVLPEVGPIGSVCAISDKPRTFEPAHLASLELAASLAAHRLEQIGRRRPGLIVRPSEPTVFEPGDVIDDKFVVTARLGGGGQANVYLARDRYVGQLVAIKIQRKGSDPSVVHEGKALARLRHRSIVQLYGWGQVADGTVYLVLEYVEGETLHHHVGTLRLRDDTMPVHEVLDITRSLAGALTTLHSFSRLHGDVKPANVILDRALDRPVLIDFGLDVALDGITKVSGGTPGWSAPEQLDAKNKPVASTALDAYGLACLAYVMLTGHGAFEGTREVTLAKQRRGAFRSVRCEHGEFSRAVDEVFARAFSADPTRRYQTPLAFSEALAAACDARPSLPPPVTCVTHVAHSRGIVFSTVRQSVAELIGPEAELRLFASLGHQTRAVFDSATDPDGGYDTAAFLDYIRSFTANDKRRLAALGEVTASLIGAHSLRMLRVSYTPETLLHVASDMLHQYHNFGRTSVRRTGSHSATLELVTPPELLPIFCRLFEGVLRALLIATGRQVSLEQTHCAHVESVSACAFDVRWAEQGL